MPEWKILPWCVIQSLCRIPPSSKAGNMAVLHLSNIELTLPVIFTFHNPFKGFCKNDKVLPILKSMFKFSTTLHSLSMAAHPIRQYFPREGGGHFPTLPQVCGVSVGAGPCSPWRAFGPMPTSGGGCTLKLSFQSFFRLPPFSRLGKMTIFTCFGNKVFDKTFHSDGRLFILVCLFSDELYLVVNMRFYKKTRFLLVKYLFFTK